LPTKKQMELDKIRSYYYLDKVKHLNVLKKVNLTPC